MTEKTERPDDETDQQTPWWEGIDLGFILLIIAIPFVAYGCEMARDLEARREVWKQCATAKEITEQCRLILQSGRAP